MPQKESEVAMRPQLILHFRTPTFPLHPLRVANPHALNFPWAQTGKTARHLGDALALDGAAVALALEGQGGHEPLDLGGLAVLLAVLLLGDAVGVDVLAHVIVLAQVEQLADLGGPLRPAHPRLLLVCQARDLSLA